MLFVHFKSRLGLIDTHATYNAYCVRGFQPYVSCMRALCMLLMVRFMCIAAIRSFVVFADSKPNKRADNIFACAIINKHMTCDNSLARVQDATFKRLFTKSTIQICCATLNASHEHTDTTHSSILSLRRRCVVARLAAIIACVICSMYI